MARRLLSLVLVLTVLVLQAAPCLAFQAVPAPKRAVPAFFAPESFPLNCSDPSGLDKDLNDALARAGQFADFVDYSIVIFGLAQEFIPGGQPTGSGTVAFGLSRIATRRLAAGAVTEFGLRHGAQGIGSALERRGGTSGGTPAVPGTAYHPEEVAKRIRPEYRPNPAHNPKSPQFNPRKSIEPKDAKKVYESAQRTNMWTWWGKGAQGWYRFFSDNAGGVHFSGLFTKKQYQQMK